MFNVADDFGVLDEIANMARQGHQWSKEGWKRKIWKRAWDLEECFWGIQALCHRSMDLILNACEMSTYLIWWQLSDVKHGLMRCCETMARIVSHASLLRADDVRLKRSSVASIFCTSCALAAMDGTYGRNLTYL